MFFVFERAGLLVSLMAIYEQNTLYKTNKLFILPSQSAPFAIQLSH